MADHVGAVGAPLDGEAVAHVFAVGKLHAVVAVLGFEDIIPCAIVCLQVVVAPARKFKRKFLELLFHLLDLSITAHNFRYLFEPFFARQGLIEKMIRLMAEIHAAEAVLAVGAVQDEITVYGIVNVLPVGDGVAIVDIHAFIDILNFVGIIGIENIPGLDHAPGIRAIFGIRPAIEDEIAVFVASGEIGVIAVDIGPGVDAGISGRFRDFYRELLELLKKWPAKIVVHGVGIGVPFVGHPALVAIHRVGRIWIIHGNYGDLAQGADAFVERALVAEDCPHLKPAVRAEPGRRHLHFLVEI